MLVHRRQFITGEIHQHKGVMQRKDLPFHLVNWHPMLVLDNRIFGEAKELFTDDIAHKNPTGVTVAVQRNGSLRAARYYNQSVNESADPSVPDTRLALYGTLAPGRVNHYQISTLRGNWQRGAVRGKLFSSGWGAALGFPGLILDPGPSVEVDVFESTELPKHWARLDEFEGSGYRRAVTIVTTAEGDLSAWIYVLAQDRP